MLRLVFAIVALFRALSAALKAKPTPSISPAEHLPDGHPDAVPPHTFPGGTKNARRGHKYRQ